MKYMTVNEYEKLLADIRDCCVNNQFDDALKLASDAIKGGMVSPELLVQQAIFIQQSENVDDGFELDDARDALRAACRLAPQQVDPFVELGYFLYAIDDKSESALDIFSTAVENAERYYLDAMIGKAKSLTDLGRKDEAADFARLLYDRFPDDPDLKILMLVCEEDMDVEKPKLVKRDSNNANSNQ